MKIYSLEAENIKRISVARINPKTNTVVVAGKNAEGKSSVIDMILYCFAGERGIPTGVLKEGEKSGEIKLDLGAVKIMRKFRKNGKTELVVMKDGEKVDSPQKFLNGLISKVSFDPMKF